MVFQFLHPGGFFSFNERVSIESMYQKLPVMKNISQICLLTVSNYFRYCRDI